jgi:hypothetical protein
MERTMPETISPSWLDLEDVICSAHTEILICSPFFSVEGLDRVLDHLPTDVTLRFWTRLSPTDWASGVSDPPQLLALLELLSERGTQVELGISQQLHAKVYAADQARALVGSANLSAGGFGGNVEIMVRLHSTEAADAVRVLEEACRDSLHPLSLPALRQWVDDTSPSIDVARRDPISAPEILAPAQARLDEVLGFGTLSPVLPSASEPTRSNMENFVDWLKDHDDLAGADMLLRRYHNVDGHNLTGHFKQCFFASWRFIEENPHLRSELSAALNSLNPDEIYEPDVPILAAWIAHVNAHAMDEGEDYRYPVLRGYLPPGLGGTRTGGGGGSSTIKRMLPLVARYAMED